MTTQQAYIDGFVKRASEYGYSESEAVALFKEAGQDIFMDPSVRRLMLSVMLGGAAGGALVPDHPIAGTAAGVALGNMIGIPWSIHHLKSRSRAQHRNKNTAKADIEALEHYHPELKKTSGLNLKAITSAIPPVKALKDTVMKAAPIQKLKDTVTKAAPIQRLTM